MFRARWLLSALMIGLVLAPPAARARALGVDVWTDRGKDAVYEPGEPVEIKVRTSDDAYILVYDIDSEGYVRVLYPHGGSSGYVVGRRTYRVPAPQSGLQLVVQGPVGEGYIVALASAEPFGAMPWYLRPYDPHAEGAGYVGEEDEQEDVTSDGRIVGDPFVAMERIRRKVLEDPNDQGAFATAYTSYYVHQPVRYPRYLCNDCHRPSYWAWWDGWDPYYTTCSAFDFRVYWGWSWGPRYWFGNVPYFCYVPRCYPCAPYDRPWYSSWGGRRQWNGLWSGHLTRQKSPPPPGYTPPSGYGWSQRREGKPLPPGFLPAEYVKGPGGVRMKVPIGANRPSIERPSTRPRPEQGVKPGPAVKPGVSRGPAGRPADEGGVRYIRPQRDTRPMPGRTPPADESRAPGRYEQPRGESRRAPAPRYEQPRGESRPAPAPRYEQPRGESRPAPAPRYEQPRGESRPAPAPRYEQPRGESRPAPARAPESRPATPGRGSERGSSGEEPSRGGERPGRR